MSTLYQTKPWRNYRSRVLAPDAECALAHLAGGCLGALHLHHVRPISEGGPVFPRENGVAVLCARHHRMLHGFINRQRKWKTCPHQHRSREARELCEQRLNAAA